MAFIKKPENGDGLLNGLFGATLLFFLLTIFFSILAIRLRKFDGLTTSILVNKLKDEDDERQIGGIIGTIAATEDDLCNISNDKAKKLRYAVYFLGFSIVLLIMNSLLSAL